jgi:hypothetical protein
MQLAVRTSSEGDALVVHVSGFLEEAGVPVLRAQLAAANGRVIVDLRELVSASSEGVAALRTIRRDGADVRNASPYVRLRLDEPAQTTVGHAPPAGREQT